MHVTTRNFQIKSYCQTMDKFRKFTTKIFFWEDVCCDFDVLWLRIAYIKKLISMVLRYLFEIEKDNETRITRYI